MDISLTPLTFAILTAGLGLIGLAIPLLILSNKANSLVRPLIVFLACSGLANSLPALIEIVPVVELYGLAIVLPCFTALPLALHQYTWALTSTAPAAAPSRITLGQLPLMISLILSLALVTLPPPTLAIIFGNENTPLHWWPQLIVIGAFILMVFWVFYSAVYVVKVLKRLIRYRQQLRDQFANNEQRELYWLTALVCMLATLWLVTLAFAVPILSNNQPPLPVELLAALHLALLWFLSLFGIRQKPGFDGRYLSSETSELTKEFQSESDQKMEPEANPEGEQSEEVAEAGKYSKSGLKTPEMTRIAQKIEESMTKNQLYLDSTLSLTKLSDTLKISPNYISQTLNEHLNTTFFDYVNSLRIHKAIPSVLEAEKSILDIAMDVGFNARSSFYKAFKKVTEQSPSEYRKNAQQTL